MPWRDLVMDHAKNKLTHFSIAWFIIRIAAAWLPLVEKISYKNKIICIPSYIIIKAAFTSDCSIYLRHLGYSFSFTTKKLTCQPSFTSVSHKSSILESSESGAWIWSIRGAARGTVGTVCTVPDFSHQMLLLGSLVKGYIFLNIKKFLKNVHIEAKMYPF